MPNLCKKGSREKRRGCNPRKRKFAGNQWTAETDTKKVSASARQLENTNFEDLDIDISCNYVICNFVTIFNFLSQILVCKSCGGEVTFSRTVGAGVSFKLAIKCKCNTQHVNSSPMIDKAAEVNRRFMFAMRMLGAGQESLKTFCSLMDISCSFSNSIYYSFLENLKTAAKAVFGVIQKKSVEEEIELNTKNGKERKHLTVSGNSSWKKRGSGSLYGITSLIGNYSGKILDLVVKSKFCQGCADWKSKKDTPEYEEWLASHEENCTANYSGGSKEMGPDGIVEMFLRSVELLGVKYKNYVGGGDVSTFKNVIDAKPYDDITPEKKECAGHMSEGLGKKGYTQYSNDSFNACVWRLAPKHLHPGSETVEIATSIAACVFNEGYAALLQIMSTLGIKVGMEAKNFAEKTDEKFIKSVELEHEAEEELI